MDDKAIPILLIDDDEVDVIAVRRAFRKADAPNPIEVVGDGIEALHRLRGTDGHAPMPRPCMILLDLNMPRMTGLEFLKEMRADPHLRHAIVFVLTSSKDRGQKRAAYDYNVAGYVIKSHRADDFLQLARMLNLYGRMVEMP